MTVIDEIIAEARARADLPQRRRAESATSGSAFLDFYILERRMAAGAVENPIQELARLDGQNRAAQTAQERTHGAST